MNYKQTTVGELAVLVDGNVVGDGSTRIYGISSIEDAQAGDVTFAENARLLNSAERSDASAVIAPQNGPLIGKPLIRVKNPRFAFAQVLRVFAPEP
ncbi:MAG TPA: LpxD N-terminal domain-containing protein, partial [Capsulimonadaceae bacterium]|nr:LpxD N-terminal domain-containing protein [Capsulimonadaceae bacterium]